MRLLAAFLAGIAMTLGVAFADDLPGPRVGRADVATQPRRAPVVELTPASIRGALDDVVARLDAIAVALESNVATAPSATIVRYWAGNIRPNIDQIVLSVERIPPTGPPPK